MRAMVRDAWPYSGHIGQSPDPLQCNYISQLRAALASSSGDASKYKLCHGSLHLMGESFNWTTASTYNFFWTCYLLHYLLLYNSLLQSTAVQWSCHPSPSSLGPSQIFVFIIISSICYYIRKLTISVFVVFSCTQPSSSRR